MEILENCTYFYTPSNLARKIYFYSLCVGCSVENGFETKRSNYDSFLIMLLEEGELYLEEQGREISVYPGEAALVDCYQPHRYGSHGLCKMHWIHFDGTLARQYFQECTKNGPILHLQDASTCQYQLHLILELFRSSKKICEQEISCRIVQILTALITAADQQHRPSVPCAIESALGFISENLHRPLTIESMAAHISMNPYYFCRLFKKAVGYTPHEYLLHARVNKARYLLRSTSMPLKEIAAVCGFSNECSFSTIFRKLGGSTPLSYRNNGQQDNGSKKV